MKIFSKDIAAEFQKALDSEEVKAAVEAITKAADTDTGTFRVVITTENLDRYSEIIKLDGWDLAHYLNNPVVLWGHDHKQLIGKATKLEVVNGQLVAEGRFAPTAQGQEMRQLYEAGFLRATSVGFMIKEQDGNVITKAELLEFSFVSVPANPYALALAMEKELDISELVRKGFMDIKEGPVVETIPEERGAVADEKEEIEARQKKWENFREVDNVIWAFMDVYFQNDTPVDDFKTLLDESISLLQKVAAGEKGLKPDSGMQAVRETYDTLKALSKEKLQALFVALEVPTGEPERTEEETPAADDEVDQEALKDFQLKRGVQVAVTLLSDVLAELRKDEEQKRAQH